MAPLREQTYGLGNNWYLVYYLSNDLDSIVFIISARIESTSLSYRRNDNLFLLYRHPYLL